MFIQLFSKEIIYFFVFTGLTLSFKGGPGSISKFFSAHQFPNLRILFLLIVNDYVDPVSIVGAQEILSSISSNCPELEVFQLDFKRLDIERLGLPDINIVVYYKLFQQLRYASLTFDDHADLVSILILKVLSIVCEGVTSC